MIALAVVSAASEFVVTLLALGVGFGLLVAVTR